METNFKNIRKSFGVNKDLSTWRKQIKDAIRQGQKSEKCIWGNKLSKYEEKGWTK